MIYKVVKVKKLLFKMVQVKLQFIVIIKLIKKKKMKLILIEFLIILNIFYLIYMFYFRSIPFIKSINNKDNSIFYIKIYNKY